MITHDLLNKNLVLQSKTQGFGKNLVLPKPVTNPWPTHVLPVITHVLKHGLGTSKSFIFWSQFDRNLSDILVSGLGLIIEPIQLTCRGFRFYLCELFEVWLKRKASASIRCEFQNNLKIFEAWIRFVMASCRMNRIDCYIYISMAAKAIMYCFERNPLNMDLRCFFWSRFWRLTSKLVRRGFPAMATNGPSSVSHLWSTESLGEGMDFVMNNFDDPSAAEAAILKQLQDQVLMWMGPINVFLSSRIIIIGFLPKNQKPVLYAGLQDVDEELMQLSPRVSAPTPTSDANSGGAGCPTLWTISIEPSCSGCRNETSQPDFRGWRATIGRAPRDCSSHSLSSRELQTASHNQKKNGGSYTCDTWIGYNKGLKTGSVRLFISLVRRRKKNSRLLLAASVAQVWMCFLIMVIVSTMSGLTYRPKGYHACRYMSLSGVGWIVSHLCVWELQAKRIGFQSWIPIWNKSRHLFPGEGWDIEGR